MILQKVFFAPLQKIADGENDTLTVEGIASTETRDSTGEVILAGAIKKALPGYRKFPTIREMHGLSAAGTALEIDVDDDGITRIVASIVDASAIKKIRGGVYRGFSIGGKVVARDPNDRKTITEIVLTEVSLVDRPANGEAKIELWKAAGGELALDPVAKATAAMQAADEKIAAIAFDQSSDAIMKIISSQRAEIDRLNKLLDGPAPAKTAGTFAISKEQDAGGALSKAIPSVEDVGVALQALDPDERALLLIKAAQQLPMVPTR